jgi:nucleotide-binding universal stress UspA family protein
MQTIKHMKNLLVPCDFSKPSINAFKLALDIAEQANGSIHLLHAIELPVIHDSVKSLVLPFEHDFKLKVKEKTLIELSKLIKRHNEANVTVVPDVEFGYPPDVISQFVMSNFVDAIVMGSHGARGYREYFIGSNAEKIVRNASVPVLVVKENHSDVIKNIVFANNLNDDDNQEELSMKVKALQELFKAKLHILFVNTPGNFTCDTITLVRLKEFGEKFSFKNYTLNIFNDLNKEAGVTHFTKRIKGDLIAMATQGRKGVSHLVNGSSAEDVVNHASSLVWTYKLNHKLAKPGSVKIDGKEEIEELV